MFCYYYWVLVKTNFEWNLNNQYLHEKSMEARRLTICWCPPYALHQHWYGVVYPAFACSSMSFFVTSKSSSIWQRIKKLHSTTLKKSRIGVESNYFLWWDVRPERHWTALNGAQWHRQCSHASAADSHKWLRWIINENKLLTILIPVCGST